MNILGLKKKKRILIYEKKKKKDMNIVQCVDHVMWWYTYTILYEKEAMWMVNLLYTINNTQLSCPVSKH